MRESPYFRALTWDLPGVLGLSIVLAVIGPFGTYNNMGLGARLAFFSSVGLVT
jgi:hypothetical protein